MKLKYRLEQFRWVKALFSPFTPFKTKWYFGKTQIGTPYFLPRKIVKATPELATKAALRDIKRATDWNKANPTSTFQHKVKSFEEAYAEQMTNRHFVPLKVGFSMCGLGWKTKWDQYITELLDKSTLSKPENVFMQTGSRKGVHTEYLGYILAEMQALPRMYPNAKW